MSVVINGLAKSYGKREAVAGLTLRVAEGELLPLAGHNGSGKTTLLHMLAGLVEPTSGTADIAGAELGTADARAHVSLLLDQPVFFDDLSVREHAEYLARLHGMPDWVDRFDYVADRIGILGRADDLPSTFSRGLRQRASIALGLTRPFTVLLVDEPFVGLDVHGRRAMEELMVEAAGEGATVIVATHQIDFVLGHPRCAVMRDGHLVYEGGPDRDTLENLLR